MTMRPRLSICICTLHGNQYDRLPRLTVLLDHLSRQARSDEVEILVASDAGKMRTGPKRNALVAAASGAYIVCVDDDDTVDDGYIPKILQALDEHPGVDVVVLRGRRTHAGGDPIEFDYRVGLSSDVNWIEGALWRSPAHLCPIRAEIVKAVPFPALKSGEDLQWGELIRPFLKTETRAGKPGEVLYHYRWDPNKITPRNEQ